MKLPLVLYLIAGSLKSEKEGANEENVPFKNLFEKIHSNEEQIASLFNPQSSEQNPEQTFIDLLVSNDKTLQVDNILTISILRKMSKKDVVDGEKHLELKLVYQLLNKDKTKTFLCAFFLISFKDSLKGITLNKVARSESMDKALNFCGFSDLVGKEDLQKAGAEQPEHYHETKEVNETKHSNGGVLGRKQMSDDAYYRDDNKEIVKKTHRQETQQSFKDGG